jgi:hypothetical protein
MIEAGEKNENAVEEQPPSLEAGEKNRHTDPQQIAEKAGQRQQAKKRPSTVTEAAAPDKKAEKPLLLRGDSDNQDQHGGFYWPFDQEKSQETKTTSQPSKDSLMIEAGEKNGNAVNEQPPSLEAGLWMMAEEASIIQKDRQIQRSVKTSDVCYSADQLEKETKNGFMLNVGQDFLSGFSCHIDTAISEGGVMFQQATCQSEAGSTLTVSYALKVSGRELRGLLEMKAGTAVFRLDIHGRKVGECATQSRYDY